MIEKSFETVVQCAGIFTITLREALLATKTMNLWERREEFIDALLEGGPLELDLASHDKTCVIWRMAGTARTPGSLVEYQLAIGFAARGVKPVVVLCNGAIPNGCVFSDPITRSKCADGREMSMSEFCASCYGFEKKSIDGLQLPFEVITIPPKQSQEGGLSSLRDGKSLRHFKNSDPEIYEIAFSSFVRWIKGDIREPQSDKEFEVFEGFVHAACFMRQCVVEISEKYQPDFSVVSHPFYVDWGTWFEYELSQGSRVVTWIHDTFDSRRFQFRSMAAGKRSFTNYPVKAQLLEQLPGLMKPGPINIIRERLTQRTKLPHEPAWSRREKTQAWCIFSHVLWDGHIVSGGGVFSSSSAWLVKTIELANRKKSIRWYLKAHPAEAEHSNSGVIEILRERGVELGSHIEFISAKSDVDTYGLLMKCDGVVTINGTIGLEAACYGRQVLLGGNAAYSGFGLAVEPETVEGYERIMLSIERLPPLSRAQVHLGQALAYQIFVNQSIALPVWGNWSAGANSEVVTLDPTKVKAVREPGVDENIDQVFSNLINGGQVSNGRVVTS